MGGCACGAVRYRLASEPYDAGWCHCRTCQRVSGAPAIAFATVRRTDHVIEQGADRVGRFRSTPFGERGFSRDCGTPLSIQVDFQADEIDIPIATLDRPDDVRPGFHIFCAEAVGWARMDDGLPRFAGFRPDTRGLLGGDTSRLG